MQNIPKVRFSEKRAFFPVLRTHIGCIIKPLDAVLGDYAHMVYSEMQKKLQNGQFKKATSCF